MNQMVLFMGPGRGMCRIICPESNTVRASWRRRCLDIWREKPCANVERDTEWLRGWLWSKGKRHDLVLVGFKLGACIALEYGLDYPD